MLVLKNRGKKSSLALPPKARLICSPLLLVPLFTYLFCRDEQGPSSLGLPKSFPEGCCWDDGLKATVLAVLTHTPLSDSPAAGPQEPSSQGRICVV